VPSSPDRSPNTQPELNPAPSSITSRRDGGGTFIRTMVVVVAVVGLLVLMPLARWAAARVGAPASASVTGGG
jgi:hypothetical protein